MVQEAGKEQIGDQATLNRSESIPVNTFQGDKIIEIHQFMRGSFAMS